MYVCFYIYNVINLGLYIVVYGYIYRFLYMYGYIKDK